MKTQALVCLLLAGCGGAATITLEDPPEVDGKADGPSGPLFRWAIDSAAPGLDRAALAQADAYAEQIGSRCMVVTRDDTIVHEYYAPGDDRGTQMNTWSIAKTFTSVLVGIAIHEGLIRVDAGDGAIADPLDLPAAKYVDRYIDRLRADPATAARGQTLKRWGDYWKRSVTLRDLLSGVSGISYSDALSDVFTLAGFDGVSLGMAGDYLMTVKKDQTEYALNWDMGAPLNACGQLLADGRRGEFDASCVDKTGRSWRYNNKAVQSLLAVLVGATGRDPLEYARQRLFAPLNMSPRTSWARDGIGNPTMYSSVLITCRDLGRFARLLRDEGRWSDGAQQVRILDADYVRQMSRPSQSLNPAYGLLTWTNANDARGGMTNTNGSFTGPMLPGAPAQLFSAQGVGQNFADVLPGPAIGSGYLFVHARRSPHERLVVDHDWLELLNAAAIAFELLTDGQQADHRVLIESLLRGVGQQVRVDARGDGPTAAEPAECQAAAAPCLLDADCCSARCGGGSCD